MSSTQTDRPVVTVLHASASKQRAYDLGNPMMAALDGPGTPRLGTPTMAARPGFSVNDGFP